MAIKKIVIDDKTQVKPLDGNKIQLDLVAFPLNEENQKEPDTELKIFINNQLLQNLTSDLQGNIKESLIISGNGEEIIIKLQDIKSCTISDIKTLMLGGKKEKKNDNALEKEKYIAQLKINPNGVVQLPEWARNDPEIVKYALEQEGRLLQYAGENVRDDEKMTMLAIQQNSQAFNYVSDFLKTDEKFILDCLGRFGEVILNLLPNYIRNMGKVRIWIDMYYTKKDELINIRQEIFNGLQEMIGLDSDRLLKKVYIEQYKKTLDDLNILIPLTEEFAKLNEESTELQNQRWQLYHKEANIFNSIKRQQQEVQSKRDTCAKSINIIREKMKKIPTYGLYGNTTSARKELYGNTISARKERNSRDLLQAEKELQIIINKINGIKAKIGNVDEKEIIRLDEEIAKLHTKITI